MANHAKFYDHAANMARPAQSAAVARARRSALADGKAYRVDFNSPSGPKYFNGCRYDCLQLAKDLLFNGGDVRLSDPNGHDVDVASARY